MMKKRALITALLGAGLSNLHAADLASTLERLEISEPEVLIYTDLEGDPAKAGAFLTQAYTAYLMTSPDIPPIPVDASKLLSRIGFLNMKRLVLASEAREGGGFVNQFFVGFDGAPSGLFLLAGDVNRPFSVADTAPFDADLAAEFSFNGVGLYQIIQNIAVDLMGPMGQGMLESTMSQRIGGTGPTFADLLNRLTTQAHIIVKLDEEAEPIFENPQIPGLALPQGQIALRIADIADIFNAFAPMFIEQGFSSVGTADAPAWKFSLPAMPQLPPLWLTTLGESNDLLLTFSETSREWYTTGARKPLSGSPDFVETIAGMPASGLSFWYANERISRLQVDALDKQLQLDESFQPLIGVIKELLLNHTGPQVGVSRLEEDAYRVISRQPTSYKSSLALFAAAMPLGLIAAAEAEAMEEAEVMEESMEDPVPDESGERPLLPPTSPSPPN